VEQRNAKGTRGMENIPVFGCNFGQGVETQNWNGSCLFKKLLMIFQDFLSKIQRLSSLIDCIFQIHQLLFNVAQHNEIKKKKCTNRLSLAIP